MNRLYKLNIIILSISAILFIASSFMFLKGIRISLPRSWITYKEIHVKNHCVIHVSRGKVYLVSAKSKDILPYDGRKLINEDEVLLDENSSADVIEDGNSIQVINTSKNKSYFTVKDNKHRNHDF